MGNHEHTHCGCGGHQEEEKHHHDHHHHHGHQHSHGDDCCGGHHHHGDDCCDHDHSHKIYLTMEGGQEVACDVLDIFTVDNQQYIALLPEEEEDAFIYRFEDHPESPKLSLIEEEAEFNKVSQVFLESLQGDEEEDEA